MTTPTPPSASSPAPLPADLLTVDLLTAEQAARMLHLSPGHLLQMTAPSSIRAYIREGKLKAFRVALTLVRGFARR